MAQHTISILQVEQIVQGARKQGLALEPILQRAGIVPALLESPLSRVTQGQYAALIRILRRATRDEIWGLCRRPLRLGTFAHLCQRLIHCRTLGEALRTGFQFLHLVLDEVVPRLVVANGTASVRWVPRGERDPCLSYADRTFCFFTYGLASWLVARRIPVDELMYRPIDQSHSQDAQRLFQSPVFYTYPWVGFCFEERWLELPVVQTQHSLGEFLLHAPASLLIKYRDQSSLAERIRRQLRHHLAGNMPSLEAVSEALFLTPQTLRRHLRDEGQGFQAIKDELRRDAAVGYLAQPELTLNEIANRLGFSEASTFHRAFKGWTGLAPGVYRQTRLYAGDTSAG